MCDALFAGPLQAGPHFSLAPEDWFTARDQALVLHLITEALRQPHPLGDALRRRARAGAGADAKLYVAPSTPHRYYPACRAVVACLPRLTLVLPFLRRWVAAATATAAAATCWTHHRRGPASLTSRHGGSTSWRCCPALRTPRLHSCSSAYPPPLFHPPPPPSPPRSSCTPVVSRYTTPQACCIGRLAGLAGAVCGTASHRPGARPVRAPAADCVEQVSGGEWERGWAHA